MKIFLIATAAVSAEFSCWTCAVQNERSTIIDEFGQNVTVSQDATTMYARCIAEGAKIECMSSELGCMTGERREENGNIVFLTQGCKSMDACNNMAANNFRGRKDIFNCKTAGRESACFKCCADDMCNEAFTKKVAKFDELDNTDMSFVNFWNDTETVADPE